MRRKLKCCTLGFACFKALLPYGNSMVTERLTFPVSGASLEGALHLPEGVGPFPGVVICHPHPHFGGSMDNNVVIGLCDGLVRSGIAALRFNYRGIGLSEGSTNADGQDIQDAVSALRYLGERSEVDVNRLGIAGYSFGGRVALRLAASQPSAICAVASVACPTKDLEDLAVQGITLPKLLINGSRDRIVSVEEFQRLVPQFQEPKEITVIEGADHFFLAREEALGDLAGQFFTQWLALRVESEEGVVVRK